MLTDVTNPLTGPNGAARVFGPQKGASSQQVEYLESCLSHVKSLLKFEEQPGDGAAGGIVYVLRNLLGAHVVSGADYVLDSQGFD